jgi:glycosyltransferase involved in cell wall biosynthesis
MKRHVMSSRISSFYVGSSGKGDATFWDMAKRLLMAPIQLAYLVHTNKYDVVHINPSFDVKSLIRDGLLILALRFIGFKKILFYYHGGNLVLQKRIAEHKIWRRIVSWLLNKNALILVLGEPFRDALLAIGVDPSRIAITRTMFEGTGLKSMQNECFASSRPFILFLSRFDPEKGGRELLEAFKAISADFPMTDLVMAGDGLDMVHLKEQTEKLHLTDRVKFTGYVGGADKWRLLCECQFFVLPTYFRGEGMPIAILEAMGAGKPVLVSSAGSISSIVSEPENGIRLTEITAATVELGLRRFLKEPLVWEKVGKHNAKMAWDTFEANAVTKEIENFYQKVSAC